MRTENSIKNVFTIIIPYFIIGVLGFVKSKVFVSCFNDDIYSLNQLFFQILGYFSLAEAGFEAFIAQKYYLAFSADDKKQINNIFATSVIHFRGLGALMLGAAFIVMFFVHYLTKAEVDGTYLKAIFMLFVVKNTVDYFMMCPRIVINSDQKAYKTNLLVNGVRIAESISDIVLALLGVDYLVILLPGICIRILFNLLINRIVYKEYPWLERKGHKYNAALLHGMSNLIYQRLACILNSNTDIILISTFVNPVSVIIYTSYNYITKFVNDTLSVMAGALTPSFANALNEGDREKSYSLFKEMNILFHFSASFFASVFFLILDPFVTLWMGEKYLITRLGLCLMIYIMFDGVCKRPTAIIINSLGLYRQTKVPVIAECALNFVISVVMVRFLGLTGVLVGTIVSNVLTTWWFYPKYIYNNIFKRSVFPYYRDYALSAVSVVGIMLLLKAIPMFPMTSPLNWVLGSAIYCAVSFVLLSVIFCLFTDSFKNIVLRLVNQVKNLKNR